VIIVNSDGDVDLAVEGIVWSAFGTSGQRCTAASRVVAHKDVYDELITKVVARAKALRLGNGLDDGTDVGPVINAASLAKIESFRAIGEADGATLLCGGERATEGDLANGHFYKPTVWGDVKPNARICPGRDLRPGHGVHQGGQLRACRRDCQWRAVRPVELDLTPPT